MLTQINKSYYPRHDDMLGRLETGISGANQWTVANINDTLFPIPFLKNNSGDFICVRIQSPHWRKQGANIDSIHIHYILQTEYTNPQTIVFDIYWTWLTPGVPVPALTNWESSLGISKTITGNKPAWEHEVMSIVENIAPPDPEGYGTTLLVRIVRGNGTYTGNFGIIDCDAHAVKDRAGSINEFTD